VSVWSLQGLGAPAGSVLLGSRDLIAAARRWRKALGAACDRRESSPQRLYALEHNVARLARITTMRPISPRACVISASLLCAATEPRISAPQKMLRQRRPRVAPGFDIENMCLLRTTGGRDHAGPRRDRPHCRDPPRDVQHCVRAHRAPLRRGFPPVACRPQRFSPAACRSDQVAEPSRTDPAGAPNPLERHTDTESNPAAAARSSSFSLTMALKSERRPDGYVSPAHAQTSWPREDTEAAGLARPSYSRARAARARKMRVVRL